LKSHRTIGVTALALVIGAVPVRTTHAQGTPPTPQQGPVPCEQDPRFHEFDFWVGDWDVTPLQIPAASPRPQSRIEKILGGCVVLENWLPPGRPGGKSFNIYNRVTRRWEQTWVDGGGNVVYFHGQARDGNMYYTSETPLPNGGVQLGKMSYLKVSADSVRQTWEMSTDAGKTWTKAFDGMYVRKKTP
jgi:hypothetical protein